MESNNIELYIQGVHMSIWYLHVWDKSPICQFDSLFEGTYMEKKPCAYVRDSQGNAYMVLNQDSRNGRRRPDVYVRTKSFRSWRRGVMVVLLNGTRWRQNLHTKGAKFIEIIKQKLPSLARSNYLTQLSSVQCAQKIILSFQ